MDKGLENIPTISNLMYEIAEHSNKDFTNSIMEFLKAEGFRPRNTATYAKNLKRKLKKRGLELKIDIYRDLPIYDGTSYRMSYKYDFKVLPIQRKECA